MLINTQLSHMGTLLDNLSKFLDSANPAEVRLLSEVLYQFDNYGGSRDEGGSSEFLESIVLGVLAGERVGQDCELYPNTSPRNTFALLALVAMRTGEEEILEMVSGLIIKVAIPEPGHKVFRPDDWPRATRKLLATEKERQSEQKPKLVMMTPGGVQ